MELDLDALERIARAVETPGPWETRCEGYKEPTRVCHDSEYVIYLGCDFAADLGAQDADHIAAFDPTTALALIAELRQEREQAAEASHAAGRHKSDAAYWENEYETAEDMKAELRAELRRARECIEKVRAQARHWANGPFGEAAPVRQVGDLILTLIDQEGAS